MSRRYWQSRLSELSKPAAVSLVPRLSTENVLCFENEAKREGTLADFAAAEKAKRPDALLLIRVGEFYEAFGLDALMLVQHAGLNPMGRKCRAGCPASNLQATLDSCTQAGLTVAVYEEVAPAGTGEGKYKKLKQRALTQVVSAASPVYIYEACLSPHEIEYTEPPPFLGVASSATGFTVVQVHLDSRTYRVHQRLSLPALKALLAARAHAPPLLVRDGRGARDAAGLASLLASVSHLGAEEGAHTERRSLRSPTLASFPEAVVAHAAEQAQVRPSEFRQLPTAAAGLDAAPRPLYTSTASQIGLIPTPGIPDLPRSLLPPTAPTACVQLLRRWLLLPPRASVADAMRRANSELVALDSAVPSCRPLAVGKLVGLLLARQANANFFHEARLVLRALEQSLDTPRLDELNGALLELAAEEGGLRLGGDQLRRDVRSALGQIDRTVADAATAWRVDVPCTDPRGQVPAGFFSRNEGWRAMVEPSTAAEEYAELEAAAAALCDAVAAALPATGATLVHDPINNALHLKPTPKPSPRRGADAAARVGAGGGGADGEGAAQEAMQPARDRNRRLLSNRFTTGELRAATDRYLAACDEASRAVRAELQGLCATLQPLLPSLVTTAHWSLFSTTLSAHAAHAVKAGWALPELRAPSDEDREVLLDDVWPYWLPRDGAVPNALSWEGIWLLTAPNMAGKSSLLRGMVTACLLANAGMLAPLRSASVPRFDAFFLRTASFDLPAEGKSAFAQEMDDLQVLTSECTPRSLVMLDELGRGTSSKEGAALSAALLEWLDGRGMAAVFATHLHEIEAHLARRAEPGGGADGGGRLGGEDGLSTLQRKCLVVEEAAGEGVAESGAAAVRMTYELADGSCNHSLAIHVARKAGLPEPLLQRAASLMRATDAEGAEAAAAAGVTPIALQGRPVGGGGAAGVGSVAETTADERSDERQLARLSEVLREVSGSDAVVRVPADWQPPPKLSGKSCLYALQLRPSHAAAAPGGDAARLPPTALYVGESDSMGARLQQHRRRHGEQVVECVVVEVESKSRALELEARTIRRLKELGVGRVTNVANA